MYREASPLRGDTTGELEGALLRPTSVRQARDSFMGSPELRVRMVSCLVALSTLTRVDSLAHVMDALKIELKEDVVRECVVVECACVCVCVCVCAVCMCVQCG